MIIRYPGWLCALFGGRIQEAQVRDQTYLRQKPDFAAFTLPLSPLKLLKGFCAKVIWLRKPDYLTLELTGVCPDGG
jgi:hypothetical protein